MMAFKRDNVSSVIIAIKLQTTDVSKCFNLLTTDLIQPFPKVHIMF